MIELIKAIVFLFAMTLSVWLIMRARKDTDLSNLEINLLKLEAKICSLEHDLNFIKDKAFANDREIS